MQSETNIATLTELGKFLQGYISNDRSSFSTLAESLDKVLAQSEQNNPWFTRDFQKFALGYWAENLTSEKLANWLQGYRFQSSPKTVGLVLAGNIPMVGFHDVLCVLLSGNKAQIKLSSKDPYLIPFLLNFWKSINDSLDFEWVEKLENFDAVIATGSDNSSLYFEQYFNHYPNIIRKNRTSVAVLNGYETEEELEGLADDLLIYFGLGCRNVTQIWLPNGYNQDLLFKALYKYHPLIQHNKYYSSYEYQRAIYLLNKDEIWDNNFLLLKKSEALFAPVAVVNITEYESVSQINEFLNHHSEKIQAVVSNMNELSNTISFGSAQKPTLNNYADGVDVMEFLSQL